MPIFTQSLQRIDTTKPQEAIKKMVNHIMYIQEQLEYTLVNLDSENITEIDTGKTNITDSAGSASVGSFISLKGENGESFTAGVNSAGKFEFVINGKEGKRAIHLNSSGELSITEHATLTIDGGTW